MVINRRQFLTSMACAPLNPLGVYAQNTKYSSLLLAACQTATGQHEIAAFTSEGEFAWRYRLAARAHQVLVSTANNFLVALERRPGTRLDIFDYNQRKLVRRILVEPGFYLYGHAQFSADGRYLITTEQQADSAQGCLVFRDTHDEFRISRILDTAGVGPHEFKVIDGGRKIVVANGGIKTQGRKKLNLDSMQSSLVYLDMESGAILESREFSEVFQQCSIRHLAMAADNSVLVAMQFEGERSRQAPLVAIHKQGDELVPLPLPEAVRIGLNQYTGSACTDSSGHFAAISAPKGNRILFWNILQKKFLGSVTLADGCGLACGATRGEFFASSGRGRLYRLDAKNLRRYKIALNLDERIKWDNHLEVLAV